MTDGTVSITPKALALELDIDPKRLRAWLRKEHTRDGEVKGTTWEIPADVADAARVRFAKAEAEAEATE